MRLVGVALLDQRRAARTAAPARRARARAARGSASNSSSSAPLAGSVLEVADDERAAARARPAPLAEGDDRLARERRAGAPRARGRCGPSGWSPNAARSIRCSATVAGWSLVARDLLDDDAALAVELLGVELRAPDEVGQQVDRLQRRLGPGGDVEGDEVVATCRR